MTETETLALAKLHVDNLIRHELQRALNEAVRLQPPEELLLEWTRKLVRELEAVRVDYLRNVAAIVASEADNDQNELH